MTETEELSNDTLRYRLARENGLCGNCRKRDSVHGILCLKCAEIGYQRRRLKSPRKRKNLCGNCFREGHNSRTCNLSEEQGQIARNRAVELAENLARIKGDK